MPSINRVDWTKDPTRLSEVVRGLERAHSQITLEGKAGLSLYYQRPTFGSRSLTTPAFAGDMRASYADIGRNKTAEVIDAALAQVCTELKSQVEPLGADSIVAAACKKASAMIDAVMEANEWPQIAREVALDGYTTAAGWAWVFVDDSGDIRIERVNPLSVFWPVKGGRNPVSRYMSLCYGREEAAERWPAHADAILNRVPGWAPTSLDGVEAAGSGDNDTIRVDVGIKRGIAGPNGKIIPGRITVVAGDVVLQDAPWLHRCAPLIPINWKPDHEGCGGVPLSRQTGAYHIQTATLQQTVIESLAGAVPAMFVHEDDMLMPGMSNIPWKKIPYRGQRRPEVVVSNPVSPQILTEIQSLSDAVYVETGVSQSAAAGMRPAGLNSEPAQLAWVDIASRRLQFATAQWARLHAAVAEAILALAQTAYRDKAVMSRAPGTQMLSEIKWSDIDLREDQWRVRFSVASGLSRSFAGRLQETERLVKSGALSQSAATRMVAESIPDIASMAGRVSAAEDYAEKLVSDALIMGVVNMPPSMDMACVESVVKVGTQEWLRAQSNPQGHRPGNVEALRRLVIQAERKMQGATPPPPAAPPPLDPMAAPPPADPSMPPADPMAPPTMDAPQPEMTEVPQ